MVVWIMGVSGAGKTTLGTMLYKYLTSKGIKCALIDGDIVRKFFDNDIGYTVKDRMENFKRMVFAVYMLEKNGIIPIVCGITPLQRMRDFARKKLKNYIEVYLYRDIEDIKASGAKAEVYKSGKNVVGIDIPFEEPKNCDIKINTGKETVDESFRRLKMLIDSMLNKECSYE